MPRLSRLPAMAAGLAVAGLAAAPAAVASSAAPGHPGTALPALSLVITSVSPQYATPRSRVTVSGTVTNTTAGSVPGLQVQLYSAGTRLTGQSAMDTYLATPPGSSAPDSPTSAWKNLATLPGHATRTWSLRLPVRELGMSAFGVYPLAAELSQYGVPLDAARTFLPFWPGKAESRVLKKLQIGWVWPLVDIPHQAACPALLDNGLAASISPAGRLSRLLQAGTSQTGLQADLTWAIDPALLSDAAIMTSGYRVGGTDTCGGGTAEPASAAARAWLAKVRTVAGQQEFFVTPYADADITALADHGLDSELSAALVQGQARAAAILHQPQPPSAGTGTLIAWPAGGIADYGVLEELAANNIGTVILSSQMMPPDPTLPYTPTAAATTPDGVGGTMRVLLANSAIAQILSRPPGTVPGAAPGGAPAAIAGPAEDFARAQDFLAETAMIAAQAPPTARAVVVTPPRRWDPTTGLAHQLLADTVDAPWLSPASLPSLAARATLRLQPPQQSPASPDQLSGPLRQQLIQLNAQIRLLSSAFVRPDPAYLSTAMAAIESSAWQGSPAGVRAAEGLARRVHAYVTAQQGKIRLTDRSRVTLGGKSGSVPVSIRNDLDRAIQVRLGVRAPAGYRVTVPPGPIRVQAGKLKTIKIPVQAAVAGPTTLTLWLTTPAGRLPHSTVQLAVEATNFGTMAIVIIGIALGVFVLTAAARAFRSGRGRGAGPDKPGEAQVAGRTGYYPAGAAQADTAGHQYGEQSDPAKEPDGHASTPGPTERR